jgi:glycine betaine catabolism A
MTPVARESLAPALAPFGQSSTLPSEAYTSESVFRWELDRFFDRTWVCIGRTEDLQTPGDQRAVALGLESALLTRDEDGGLHAFYNVCRHRGHELLERGCGTNQKFIRCLYHAWAYGLDGVLAGAPGLSSRASIETVTRSCPSASSSGTAGSSRTPAGTLPRSGSTSATSES